MHGEPRLAFTYKTRTGRSLPTSLYHYIYPITHFVTYRSIGSNGNFEVTTMKYLVIALILFQSLIAQGRESPSEDERPKTFRRLIPADVLRDFPGMCFASTKCATVEPGKSWELSPFCGRSTCVPADDDSGHLFELVEDCGPLPKANPKCKLSDKTNKTASFPDCCPIFECEAGAKLEFPEIPTVPPTEVNDEKSKDSTTSKP